MALVEGLTNTGLGTPNSASTTPPSFTWDSNSEEASFGDYGSSWLLNLFSGGTARGAASATKRKYQEALDQYQREREAYEFEKSLEFNASEAEKSRLFNASEAEKAREFQKMLSDTSIQRRMSDLKAAGLNPALAVSGSGASAGGVSTASGGTASAGGHSTNTSAGSSKNADSDYSAGIIAGVLKILAKIIA